MNLLDGKALAQRIQTKLRSSIRSFESSKNPGLAFILVGEHPSSMTYVGMKQKACQQVGIESFLFQIADSDTTEDLLILINKLNCDENVHGIIIQQPLPKHMDLARLVQAIDPKKDVDGFHPINMGKLLIGDDSGFVPCTPKGVLRLLEFYKIPTRGKEIVILGRSNIVGKPLLALLIQKTSPGDATVTLCHSHTQDLFQHTKRADILICAAGVPKLIKPSHVKEGVVCVDVGNSRVEDDDQKKGYSISGDVDFDCTKEKSEWITPVPGGVGPMTIAMLLENTYEAFLNQENLS